MKENDSCGALIKQIHNELEKTANAMLREQNLTMAQLGALLVLNESPEKAMPLKQLERELHIAQSTTVGIVSRLEQHSRKYVETCGSSTDGRIKIVHLTKAGEAMCMEAYRNMQKAEQTLLHCLNEQEREMLQTLLKKVRNTLV